MRDVNDPPPAIVSPPYFSVSSVLKVLFLIRVYSRLFALIRGQPVFSITAITRDVGDHGDSRPAIVLLRVSLCPLC
jgi:hypothetical protein